MLSNNIKIPQQTEPPPLLPLFKVLSLYAKMLNKTIRKNPTHIILPSEPHFEKNQGHKHYFSISFDFHKANSKTYSKQCFLMPTCHV